MRRKALLWAGVSLTERRTTFRSDTSRHDVIKKKFHRPESPEHGIHATLFLMRNTLPPSVLTEKYYLGLFKDRLNRHVLDQCVSTVVSQIVA